MSEEKICVQILGCGDAFGTGGKFHTCFLLQSSSTNALIDCGATSLTAMNKFNVSTNSIDYIFISHFHGDHYGGIPFFLLEASLVSKRTKPLVIVGPNGIQSKISQVQETLYPNSSSMKMDFDLIFIEMENDQSREFGVFHVTMNQMVHSPESSPHSIRIEFENRCIAYTGDTEWHDGLIDLADGADLLIAESYSYDKKVKYHTSYKELLENVTKLNCKRMVLTHMGSEVHERLHLLELEYAKDGECYYL